jgi:hypothetical protein
LLPLLHGPYLKKNDFYVTAPREIWRRVSRSFVPTVVRQRVGITLKSRKLKCRLNRWPFGACRWEQHAPLKLQSPVTHWHGAISLKNCEKKLHRFERLKIRIANFVSLRSRNSPFSLESTADLELYAILTGLLRLSKWIRVYEKLICQRNKKI